jgi:hypothetical protein
MSKIVVVAIFIVLAISNAFIPSNLGRISTKSSVSKHDLNMMFGFNSGSSNTIPGDKKVCVITGTTSGLGKETARALLNKGDYYVICACRDVEKMNQVAEEEGFDRKRSVVYVYRSVDMYIYEYMYIYVYLTHKYIYIYILSYI